EGSDLKNIKGWVEDSGEGRWTVLEAVTHGVPMTAIAHSLFARFVSRQEDSYAMKVAAALRNQFGGHAVKKQSGSWRPRPSTRCARGFGSCGSPSPPRSSSSAGRATSRTPSHSPR